MYLFRMVYYSRVAIGQDQDEISGNLKSILASSARNNRAAGVSGALLFNRTYFAQVLEGDRKAITTTFCRIAADPRHSDLVILKAEPINQRVFELWSMGHVGHTDISESLFLRYGTTPELNPAKMSAESLTTFIRELVDMDKAMAQTRVSAPHRAA